MKLLQITAFISFLFLFVQCDYFDYRVQVINHSKREKILSLCVVGQQTCGKDFGTLNCTELNSYTFKNRIFHNFDTLNCPLPGKNSWENLKKQDTVVIYVFDKLKFEQYCSDSISYDSCYQKLTYTQEDLIKVNWKIIIDR